MTGWGDANFFKPLKFDKIHFLTEFIVSILLQHKREKQIMHQLMLKCLIYQFKCEKK
jgi:hypothetical protein